MKLFNTLTKQIEPLNPINAPQVTIYTCGPTVYDYPHVGNWYTFIRYDLLVRTLLESGYEPNWVMNITDVGHLTSDSDDGEDKLARRATKDGQTAWDIAQYYTDYFKQALIRLNFIMPQQLPKATDHIEQQLNLIKILETKGYTYLIDDGVYYDTSKFPTYSDFAKLDIDEQQTGTRIEANQQKRNPADFALWKFSPISSQRDMEWDSPWGKGFPGWHIECSAMCLHYLGETVDIHSGGIDHIPVHHTNEIAQSQAITNKPLANIWMHTNHILINDEKISKSLGNGITLEDIKQNNISLEALRLQVLESHYRSQSKFSWESLQAAQTRLLRYKNFAVLRFQVTDINLPTQSLDILTAMQDDLNTPGALLIVEKFMDQGNAGQLNHQSIVTAIELIDRLFGLDLMKQSDISQKLKTLIEQREQARDQNNWLLADEIRSTLMSHNIGLRDEANGPIWYYLS